MADLWMIKGVDGALYPSSEQEEEYLQRFKAGEVFLVNATMKRNGKHHRLGMAMLQEVFRNQDRYTNFEAFLTEVKILTGCAETHISLDGSVFYKVGSIAFDRMDELEFGKWKSEALTAVFEHFIPGMTQKDQDRVINNLLARM